MSVVRDIAGMVQNASGTLADKVLMFAMISRCSVFLMSVSVVHAAEVYGTAASCKVAAELPVP